MSVSVTDALNPLTDKQTLGIVRLLNTGALFYLVAKSQSRWKIGRVASGLAYLGRNSLQVYTFHVIMVCFLAAYLERVDDWSTAASALMTIVCVSGLFLPAWCCERRRAVRAP